MADRQFPHRPGPDPRDQARSSPALLPRAAQARRGAAGRLSAGLRPGLGLRRPYGQPFRRADALPVRRRLSAGAAAPDRRALGDRHHLAHRAGGESSPLGPADRGRARGAPGGRPFDRPPPGDGRGEAETATAVFGNLGSMPLPAAFAAQLVQRLRDQDPKTTPALLWLDQRLAAQGTTADEIVREEHQSQGASNITVRNIITSMRLISAVNWAALFEKISLVDAALRAGSGYGEMDFRTRDLYRRAIEELSRYSTHTELEVTELALAAAGAEGQQGAEAERRCGGGSAPARPRLSPHRQGAPRIREAARLSDPAAPMAHPCQCSGGHFGLSGGDRDRHRDHRRLGPALVCGGWRRMAALAPGYPRRHSRLGCRRGAGEPRRDEALRRHHPAGPGAARRRAGELAHHDRGADAPDQPGRDRGADRASGSPLPGE